MGCFNKNVVYLCILDYVFYFFLLFFKEIISEFIIWRDMFDYMLDIVDDCLCEREIYVLKEVMNYIVDWDVVNEKKYFVIGV